MAVGDEDQRLPEAGASRDPALPPPDSPTAAEPVETMPPAGSATVADQASMAGEAPGPAPARRSVMPGILSVIGLVVAGLLAANLWALYNPPGNSAVPTLQGDVARLGQRIDSIEARPEAKPVDLSPLNGRVTALANDVSALKAGGQTAAGLPDRVAGLEKTVDTLQKNVAALPKVDLAPVDAKLAEIDKRLQPLEAYFNAPKTTEQVTTERQNGSAAETRAAPQAVIAGGILDALATGRPFPDEVKALRRLGVDPEALKPLEAVAAGGAATVAALQAGLPAVQDGVAAAAAPVSTGTMLDRMMANAAGLVKVSRTGTGNGDAPDAVESRLAAALDRGDLAAAAAEWDKLPEAARNHTAEWGGRLKQRVAADDAAHAVQRKAVEALAAAP